MRDNNPNWRVCKVLLHAYYGVLSRHAAGESQVYYRKSKSYLWMTHLVPVVYTWYLLLLCRPGRGSSPHRCTTQMHEIGQALGATPITQR